MISELAQSSLYSEKVCACVKDSIFDGLNPFRPTAELLDILRTHNKIPTPYLSLFSIGGGSHNIIFLNVQCMLLALSISGGFDVLKLGRFLGSHINEGLYLLQFQKCYDASCFTLQIEKLPPPGPVLVLSLNNSHYMDFNSLHGKVSTMGKKIVCLFKKTQRGQKEE